MTIVGEIAPPVVARGIRVWLENFLAREKGGSIAFEI